jgi:DMSO/TMAO reductase YedYZ heme-binding membrane subunit
VIAVFGVLSLLTGRPVIAGAGELVGPAAVTAATLLLCGCLLLRALRVPESRQRVAPLTALAIGVAAYAVYAVFAAGADLMSVDPLDALAFLGTQLIGPFALAVGIVAFVIALLYMLVLASRLEQRGRPLWPWEKDDDD